ncbi:MAG: histidinol-phosphatase HisJ family protein [Candidatus Aureabacteria bacterium]|nr:histidinol-phosphatase HisJ family protein [Candidatus Auribacterota bacterium]
MQDWHIHNFVSHDASGHVDDFVISALEKGLDTIVFANHPERMNSLNSDFEINMDLLLDLLKKEKEEIDIAREKYGERLKIYQGIELENRESLKKSNEILLEKYKFDVVIGSCHVIGKHSVSSNRHLFQFEKTDEDTMYNLFFDEALKLIESFPFQILGHFDIVKRYGVVYYGTFNLEKYLSRINEIFNLLKEKNIGLEINTSGLFQNPKDSYPSEDIALKALEKGVPFVVTGSDAHKPADIARGFDSLKGISMYNKGLSFIK